MKSLYLVNSFWISLGGLRPLLAGALALLSIPLINIALGWQWSPADTGFLPSRFSLWVSESMPVVALALIAWVLFRLKLDRRRSLLLVATMMAALLLGVGVKTVLKDTWQEPRPYAVWLAAQTHITAQDFYALPDKSGFIAAQDLSKTSVPQWEQQYWAKNTGYSFPSGHSLFAVQLVLMLLALLWQRKAYILMLLALCWAMAILLSRLFLGMHWPVDVLASSVLAFILNIPFCLFWNKQTPSLLNSPFM